MKMLVFSNAGEIDIRAVTTFGVSAKEGDNPIGKFGTGLKYAIAGVLRLGGTIRILTCEDEFTFASRVDLVRGKEFSFVTMQNLRGDPAEIGFTTDLGAHWEPWMIFRELYSNMLDENGSVEQVESTDEIPDFGIEDTIIIVDCAEMDEVFAQREKYFPQFEGAPLFKNSAVEIWPGRASGLFFKGILALPFAEGTESSFTYNVLHGELSEDRLLKAEWNARWNITALLIAEMQFTTAVEVFTAGAETWESGFDWSVGTMGEGAKKAAKMLEVKGILKNKSARAALLEADPAALSHAVVTLSKEQRAALNKAQALLEDRITAYTREQLSVTFVSSLEGESTLVKDGKLFLTTEIFELSIGEIAATLLENWVRTKSHLPKCDGAKALARLALGLVVSED